ncbi:MAG: small subunit ribosomal protein [Pseudomonadota bacterium]
MANTPQSKKRARQAVKSRARNAAQRSTMRTYVKRVIKAIASSNKALASAEFQLATSSLDRLASKGLIHKNKAARHKQRLSAQIKALVG